MVDRVTAGQRAAVLRARIAGGGSSWLPRDARHAIYARDGHACACCAVRGGRNGAGLTVDHIRSQHGEGGDSNLRNLVTMCNSCNSSKQATPLDQWVNKTLVDRGHDPRVVMQRVHALSQRPIDLDHGEALAQIEEDRRKPPLYNDLVIAAKRRMAVNAQAERRVGRPNRYNTHPLDDLTLGQSAGAKAAAAPPTKVAKAAQAVQKGKKGGTFVVTAGGKRRYIKTA